MAPKASQHPATPGIRRPLLNHAQPRRRRDLGLTVLFPTRQLLAGSIQDDERRKAARAGHIFDPDFRGLGVLEVGQRLGPVQVILVRRADHAVHPVRSGCAAGVAGGAEADGRKVAVGALGAVLATEHPEPVDGPVLVRVQAQFAEMFWAGCIGRGVQRAEERVFVLSEPGVLRRDVVADQG